MVSANSGSTARNPIMRFFNTEGPIRRDRHYHVPPLDRVNLDDLLGLVRDERYFVLHAPRQTGKTSALLALRDLLNAGSDYRCVYVTVEAGQAARENVADAMRVILYELESEEQATLGSNTLADVWPGALERAGPLGALRASLARWCMADPQPLVLLIDEIDTLVGDTLLSVLRQLRAGYPDRPGRFPHSVILCGVRDVRDYRIYSTARNALVLGGSAFNIKSKSLRLGDFTEAETRALLAQHTEETGQAFTADARAAVWTRTAGQPWLVNALCREACFENQAGRDRSRAITEGDILDAQERLILARVTHLDDLADKLREDRVRRVVAPMLTGAADRGSYADRNRDVEYARDLGLLAQHDAKRIANPIYAEVIPRELTWVAQDDVEMETAWYVDAGGGLDVDKLLAAFQQFFREHSWSWPDSVDTYPLGEEEESTMPKSRPPYPAAFRQQMVELVRSGRTPGELAREFEPSAEAIRNWVAQADRDAGKRTDGLRTEEQEEIRRLRRENRQLREEREILAKATAWFARETGPGRTTGS